MLDMKFVRDNLDAVRTMLKNRNNPLNLDNFAELEKSRRDILNEVEQLKNQRNATSKKIGAMKKAGEDTTAISAEMRAVGDKISALDNRLREIEENLRDILLHIPNMPKDDVPKLSTQKSAASVRHAVSTSRPKPTGKLAAI